MCRGQRDMSFDLAGHQDVHHRVRFELRMPLSELLLRAGRPEERERMPSGRALSASSHEWLWRVWYICVVCGQ